jgi:hypothetical protein
MTAFCAKVKIGLNFSTSRVCFILLLYSLLLHIPLLLELLDYFLLSTLSRARGIQRLGDSQRRECRCNKEQGLTNYCIDVCMLCLFLYMQAQGKFIEG